MTINTSTSTDNTPMEAFKDPVPTPTAPAATEETVEPLEPADAPEGKAGKEAAKYRRQLRDTEAERDTLTSTVDSLRRQILAQNMPAGSNAGAELLWAAGHEPADLFTAEGVIDGEKLTQAARAAHEKFGLHFGLSPIPESGSGPGHVPSAPTWSDALKKK